MLIILTTTPNKKEAKNIARILFEYKLVACIQITKISSMYLWESKLCDEKEFLLYIKTQQKHAETIKNIIIQYHSYDIPEIIEIAPNNVNKKYLEWIRTTT
ncbi:divalent-cation tolerance protein CutA [Helicobacter didelphidarum]|nr:divalent-cation tolerance protein CutA [Helicobacter didelphidarum]